MTLSLPDAHGSWCVIKVSVNSDRKITLDQLVEAPGRANLIESLVQHMANLGVILRHCYGNAVAEEFRLEERPAAHFATLASTGCR